MMCVCDNPVVCMAVAGECLADVCLAHGDVCWETGHGWAPGRCVDGSCKCSPVTGQDMRTVGAWASENGGALDNKDPHRSCHIKLPTYQ